MLDISTVGEQSGWLANLIQILTYLGLPSLPVLVIWLLRKRNLKKKTLEDLSTSVSSLSLQVTQMNEKLALAKQRDPQEWIKAYKAHADQHEAANCLRDSLSQSIEPLLETFLVLAKYNEECHLQHGENFLFEARRLARIAALLDPTNKEAAEQLQLIDAIIEIQDVKSETFDPSSIASDLPEIKLPDEEFTAAYVSKLIRFAIRKLHSGDGAIYEVITRYARDVAMQHLTINDELTLTARQLWAESLAINNLADQAYEELKAILPIMKDVMAADDRRLQEALLIEGQLLTALGDPEGPAKMMTAMKFFSEFKETTQPYGDYNPSPMEVPNWLSDKMKETLKKVPTSFKDQTD